MVAIFIFWSTAASDDVMADPVALLSITITHSWARFWPQKEKPQPQLFCHFFLFLLFFALAGLPDQKLQNMPKYKQKSPINIFSNKKNRHFWTSLVKTGITGGQQSAAVHVITGFFFEASFGQRFLRKFSKV